MPHIEVEENLLLSTTLNPDDRLLARIPEMALTSRRMIRSWAKVNKAQVNWDFAALAKGLEAYGADLEAASSRWGDVQRELQEGFAQLQAHTRTDSWTTEVETALRDVGIPIRATSDREYEFPPFKLVLNVQEGYIRLALGRKSERTTALAPNAVASWVHRRYDRVVNSRFDAVRFKKELMAAYQIGNRAKYGPQVLWGNSVELSLIYELLTLRQSARQDYPRQLFTFDLARLREEPDLNLDGQSFEFGFARDQDKVFVVIDRHGREARLAGLSIFDKRS